MVFRTDFASNPLLFKGEIQTLLTMCAQKLFIDDQICVSFQTVSQEKQDTVSKQGHCRFVYNKLLEIAKTNKDWNYYKYKRLLPKLKKSIHSYGATC